MKKRMLSAILAMSMVMGMGTVTAFAADGPIDPNGDSVDVTNDGYEAPVIDVTVPTITKGTGITLDPYNIAGKGQIYSPEYKVVNNSNVPVVFTLKGAVASSDTVDIVAKKLTNGTKWASVSVSITDGLEKTTTKVVPMAGENVLGVDVVGTTYMAAYGGTASFKYTGMCADNVTAIEGEAEEPAVWNEDDAITVSAKYSFAPVQCTNVSVTKALKVSTTAITVENGTTVDNIVFPVVLGDGKEIPVTWKCVDAGGSDATYDANTAGDYKFTATITAEAKASGLYSIAESITTWPTITVTVEEATTTTSGT